MNLKQRKVCGIVVGCAVVLGISAGVRAAELSEPATFFPEETLVYFGWSGCERMQEALAETAWGKTLAEPQVKRFREKLCYTLDFLLKRLAAEEDSAQAYEAGRRMLKTVVQRPTGIALIDFGMSEQGPGFQAALVCQVGEEGEGFLRDFHTLLQEADMPPGVEFKLADWQMYQLPIPVPGGLFYGVVEGHFIVAVGVQGAEAVVKQVTSPSSSLAKNAKLTANQKKIGGKAQTRAASFFADTTAVLDRVRQMVPMFTGGNPDDAAEFEKVVSLVGLEHIDSVCWELHHRAGGCQQAFFMRFDGAPTGLLSFFKQKPLTQTDLAGIPKEPSWAAAFNADVSGGWEQVLELLTRYDAGEAADFQEDLAEAEAEIGFRLMDDLFKPLGDTFVIFDAPENGGILFSGITAIVEASDPARLQGTFRKIVKLIAEEIDEDEMKLGVSSFEYRSHQIEFVNLTGVPMPVAPAWSNHEGRIVIGLYPQMVQVTLDRMLEDGRGAHGLNANPEFVKGIEALGGLGSTMGYVNNRRGVEQLYSILLPAAEVGAAMAQGEGADVDISCFPSRDALTKHVFAYVETMRVDADGVLCGSYGSLPIPLPRLSDATGMQAPLLVSILLPSLSRARHLAKRSVSAANLHGIAISCMIYANDNDEKFPPDLETLVQDGSITRKQLKAPNDAYEGVSYVYIAGQTRDSDSRNVLAHERRGLNDGEGVNVAFVDGHVEFMKMREFGRVLAATQERLNKEPG